MEDTKVIELFVNFLSKNGYPGLRVDRRPDKETSGEIDAIAGPFAIEHTSIDTLKNQRGKDHWFLQVVGGLELELNDIINYRLNIKLRHSAVNQKTVKKQQGEVIRKNLKEWIVKESPALTDGEHVIDNIPGIPFFMHIKKTSDRPPGIFFNRTLPKDSSLKERVNKLLDNKAKKLSRYQGPDWITILLLECVDMLMSEDLLEETLREIYPDCLPPGVDQLWFADTSIANDIEFKNVTLIFEKFSK